MSIVKNFESNFSISVGYRYMTNGGIIAQAYPIFILKDNPLTKNTLSFGIGLGYSW